MLRKILFPIAAGLIVGKGVSMFRDRRYVSRHPVKSMFFSRRRRAA